ncbi:MAG: thioredoxin family protein [Tannerellaceae bacterium]|jgi:thiol-disulfide isomerase/thioredoxin|nr:thioredoxin family protein [Tannerellaceae bacterium]
MSVRRLTTSNYQEIFTFVGESPSILKYVGERLALIEFYADWCTECHEVASSLEELSEEFADRIDTYKVDVEKDEVLPFLFNIYILPTFLFITVHSELLSIEGALPKPDLKRSIEKLLSK